MDPKHVDHSGVVPESVKSEVGIVPEGTGDVLLCRPPLKSQFLPLSDFLTVELVYCAC